MKRPGEVSQRNQFRVQLRKYWERKLEWAGYLCDKLENLGNGGSWECVRVTLAGIPSNGFMNLKVDTSSSQAVVSMEE